METEKRRETSQDIKTRRLTLPIWLLTFWWTASLCKTSTKQIVKNLTVKCQVKECTNVTSFVLFNELVWVVQELIIFLVYTNLTRSTDIYNKSNKLNWANIKRCLHVPEKSGPRWPWPSESGHVSPDIWTPVTHSPELNAQNNLGAISVDSKTF